MEVSKSYNYKIENYDWRNFGKVVKICVPTCPIFADLVTISSYVACNCQKYSVLCLMDFMKNKVLEISLMCISGDIPHCIHLDLLPEWYRNVALCWIFKSDSISFSKHSFHSGEQLNNIDLTKAIYKNIYRPGDIQSYWISKAFVGLRGNHFIVVFPRKWKNPSSLHLYLEDSVASCVSYNWHCRRN